MPTSLRDLLLQDEEVLSVLVHLLDSGILEVAPEFTPRGVVYPALAEILESSQKVREVMGKLVDVGVVDAVVLGRAVVCPQCRGPGLVSYYVCPRCGSTDVRRIQLMVHVTCGYIDTSERFHSVSESTVYCPNCGREVPVSEVQVFGTCFECGICGARFDMPEIKHFCMMCRVELTRFDVDLEPLLLYRFRRDLVEETTRTVVSVLVAKVLQARGLKVEFDARLRGVSGVEHVFDVSARSESGDLILIDICPNPDKLVYATSSLVGKALDVEARAFFLVHPVSVTRPDFTTLAMGRALYSVEYGRLAEVPERFSEVLTQVLGVWY